MKKKEVILFTIEETKSYRKQEVCYLCKKEFNNDNEDNGIVKDLCNHSGKYRGAAHNMCNLRYKTPKEISAIFHNGSKYDYHFIFKEVAEEFEGQFECLGENTEKYNFFSTNKEIT